MTGPAGMTLPAPVPAHGLPGRIAERVRLWRRRRRWIIEMQDAAALGRLDRLLDDIGMTRAELKELMAAPADAGQQFEMLARMEGIDLNQLPAEVLREAMWKCTRCDCRAACKRWLRSGVWDYEGDPRCPNAALLHH